MRSSPRAVLEIDSQPFIGECLFHIQRRKRTSRQASSWHATRVHTMHITCKYVLRSIHSNLNLLTSIKVSSYIMSCSSHVLTLTNTAWKWTVKQESNNVMFQVPYLHFMVSCLLILFMPSFLSCSGDHSSSSEHKFF